MEIHMKEKVSKMIKISICSALFLMLSLGVIYATNILSSKGELNDDGIIDYGDVSLLESHLIHVRTLPEEKLSNADMNSDGEITVTDLSLLIRKIENKRDYHVELTNLDTSNYYPEKGSDLEITFGAVINYDDVRIEKLVINNQEYKIENENGSYKVKLKVGTQAGKQEYTFTKVILNTGAEVKIDDTFIISVRKTNPYIEENSYRLEESFEGKAYINFDLIDEDQSITSAQFTVYEVSKITDQPQEELQVEDSETQIVQANIKAGENRQEVIVEDGKTYRVEICVAYNTVLEPIEGKDHMDSSLLYNKEFTMALDYQFSITNIHTQKEGSENSHFAKKEPIQIIAKNY